MKLAKQYAQRKRRAADHESQQREPHDLVDQRGAAATDEQQRNARSAPKKHRQDAIAGDWMSSSVTTEPGY